MFLRHRYKRQRPLKAWIYTIDGDYYKWTSPSRELLLAKLSEKIQCPCMVHIFHAGETEVLFRNMYPFYVQVRKSMFVKSKDKGDTYRTGSAYRRDFEDHEEVEFFCKPTLVVTRGSSKIKRIQYNRLPRAFPDAIKRLFAIHND